MLLFIGTKILILFQLQRIYLFFYSILIMYLRYVKKHTKIYLEAFGYDLEDFIPCEISGYKAVDIHHIESRGMGGNPTGSKDRVENLMAVTRKYHELYGDDPKYMAYLFKTHLMFMELSGVKFDRKWIERKIKQYENTN